MLTMPFQPGQSGNPTGRPKGYQSYSARAAYLLDSVTTEQLVIKQSELDKMPVRDAMIFKNAFNALFDTEKEFAAQERERLVDRTDGKPKQALTGGDEDDKPLIPTSIEIILKGSGNG